jgi:hypothetical protein
MSFGTMYAVGYCGETQPHFYSNLDDPPFIPLFKKHLNVFFLTTLNVIIYFKKNLVKLL